MYIEFNISLNGKHLFATHERSCRDSDKANTLKEILVVKFPESEGYKVSAFMNPERSYGLSVSKDMKEEVNKVYNEIRD